MDYLNNLSFPKCQKCKTSLNISYNNNTTITFSCQCYKHIIPISSYYSFLNHNSSRNCNQHPNNSLSFYCIDCLSSLCTQCITEHQTHFVVSLSNESHSILSKFKLLHNEQSFKDITCLLLLQDGRLCISSEMIKIYNYTTKTFEQSFSHKDFVSNVCSMLQLKNTILVVSYAQTGLVFYNIYDNKSQPYVIKATAKDIRDGLTNTELCHIDEKRFAACLLNTITILSSNPPYDKLFVLEGHISTIASMIKIKNKNILISASQHKYTIIYSIIIISDDKKEDTVRIWDLENKNCMKIINDIDCYSKQIVQYDERIAIIGGYEQIILIDFINLKIDAVIEDENIKDLFVYSLLKIDDNNILLGCEKEMKKESVLLGVLDVKNRKIMETQERYLNHISDLIFINKNVIAIGGNSLEIIQKE